jgi:DNA-binding PadR family transcriptional regulator
MQLRYAVLALLADGEAHGYALLKRFSARLGPHWQPNIGQVYQVMHQLERRGLVARRDTMEGHRLRRCYRLTPRGDGALRAWLARRPGWPAPLRDELLVRMLAAERDGASALERQLARQEEEFRRYLALVSERLGGPGASISRRLADEGVRLHAEAQLRWLERCRELLAEPVAPRPLAS